MNTTTKSLVAKLGRHSSPRMLHLLNATNNYLSVGLWINQHVPDVELVTSRSEVYAGIAAEVVAQNAKVLYLEFGVWRGESMREWSTLLPRKDTVLHGFDSFEGLPEDWNIANEAGHFSTHHRMPEIDDERVRFFPGWFNDTLSTYDAPEHDLLIVNIDADLYSSTKCVLDSLEPLIVPGTYIYFDEFSDRLHELRAFDEYLTRTGAKYRAVAATREMSHVGFQII